MHQFSRRRFLGTASMALPVAHMSAFEQQAQSEGGGATVADTYPMQAPAMVREAVVTSHGKSQRSRSSSMRIPRWRAPLTTGASATGKTASARRPTLATAKSRNSNT